MRSNPRIVSFYMAAILIGGLRALNAAILEWDPVTINADGTTITDLAGYRVFYRTTSLLSLTTTQATADATITQVTVAAPATSLNLSGFAPGVYFFRITAYDTAGNQSGFNLNLSNVLVEVSTAITAGPSPPPPAGNLVGHWKFDESSGLNAADASGSGNVGTLVNGPVWSAGKMGGALTFDGANDGVGVAHSASLNPGSGSFTIAGWIKTTSTGNMVVFAKGYDLGGGTAKFNLHILGGKLEGRLYSTSVSLNLPASTRLVNNGAWRHIALVVDRSIQQADYFIDGVKEGVNAGISTVASVDNNYALDIGHKLGVWPFSGQMDDLRLYTRALSSSELQGLAGQSPPRTCDANGDSTTNIVDVQLAINQALGSGACSTDVNGDGLCTIIDVQRIVNAALGGLCLVTP